MGWTLPFDIGARLDDVPAHDHCIAKSHTRDFGDSGPSSGCCDVRAFARAWRGSPARCDSVSAEHYVSCRSGLADERRYRADAVAAFRQSPTSARVDSRGAGYGGRASRSCRASAARMSGALLLAAAALLLVLLVGRRKLAAGCAICSALAGLARCGALRQPASARREHLRRSPRRNYARLRQTARRTWRYFETLRDRGRQYAAAGQFSGRARPPRSPIEPRRPISDSISSLSSAPATSVGLARPKPSNGLKRRLRLWFAWRASAAIFTIGTTPAIFKALEPKYVSSVDSGNLAGHLIAVANACREWQAIAGIRSVTPGWSRRHTRADR